MQWHSRSRRDPLLDDGERATMALKISGIKQIKVTLCGSGVVVSQATANRHLPLKWLADLRSETLDYFVGGGRHLIHFTAAESGSIQFEQPLNLPL